MNARQLTISVMIIALFGFGYILSSTQIVGTLQMLNAMGQIAEEQALETVDQVTENVLRNIVSNMMNQQEAQAVSPDLEPAVAESDVGLTGRLFRPILILATLLVALTAGLLFAFAIVVMPVTKNLDDAEFIRAFQVMDGIIQNNQPLFMLVWVGSAITLVLAVVTGFGQGGLLMHAILFVAVALYFLGVQVPTVTINIPLNNEIQAVKVETLDRPAQKAARDRFEGRWNRANQFRTGVAVTVTTLLLLLLLLI